MNEPRVVLIWGLLFMPAVIVGNLAWFRMRQVLAAHKERVPPEIAYNATVLAYRRFLLWAVVTDAERARYRAVLYRFYGAMTWAVFCGIGVLITIW